LDLSASDHALTHTNVENSWSAAYPVYRYPMIYFGSLVSGEYGVAAKWYPNDFIPMIQVKEILTKILSPYTISSTWLATASAKDLFILGKEILLPDTFIQNKALDVSVALDGDNDDTVIMAASETGTGIGLSDVTVIFGSPTKDEASAWSGTHHYTIPETGTYRFTAIVKTRNDAFVNDEITITEEAYDIAIVRLRGASRTNLYQLTSPAYVATELLHLKTFNLDTAYIHLLKDDEISIIVTLHATLTNSNVGNQTCSIGLETETQIVNVWDAVNKYPGISKNISLEEYLPDMTQLDFIAAIRDIFNLRFWMDKMKRVIYIEPWDSFLSSTVIDLTSYVDFESIDQELISQNYNETISLRFKDDTSDVAFTEYLKNNLIGPGSKDITLTSEFAKKGIDIREHPFSTLITGNNYTTGDYSTNVPRIWAEEPILPYNIFKRKVGFNTRIVEWKGLTSGFTWYYETYTQTNYPKIAGLDFSTIYTDYWQKLFHYIDKGKILTLKIKISPIFLSQFFTVINTATSEGFRPTYSITINGIKNYFFIQKITSDGYVAECEMVLKQ
jgi:hypothetical protein